jgi:hypothetical protein
MAKGDTPSARERLCSLFQGEPTPMGGLARRAALLALEAAAEIAESMETCGDYNDVTGEIRDFAEEIRRGEG